jgi:hypothetical protein
MRRVLTPALVLALLASFAAAGAILELAAVLAEARAADPGAARRRWAAGAVGALRRPPASPTASTPPGARSTSAWPT